VCHPQIIEQCPPTEQCSKNRGAQHNIPITEPPIFALQEKRLVTGSCSVIWGGGFTSVCVPATHSFHTRVLF